MSENELIAVMVPKQHLSKVYGLIAQLESASPTVASVPTEPPAEATGEWTTALLRRMVQESPRAMRDVLKAMADKAGSWVSVHDLASAISNKPDANWNTLAGAMGAFGRRVRNRYQMKKKPFEKRYDHAAHCKMFRMSKEVAAQVVSALQNGA